MLDEVTIFGLLDAMSNYETILIAIASTYIALFFSAFNKIDKERKKQKISNDDEFFNTLINTLKMGNLSNLEDFYNLYKGYYDLELENNHYRNRVNKFLRKFLYKLHNGTLENVNQENIKEWKIVIDEMLETNERLSPFSEIPSTERNIMNDILVYSKRNDSEAIERKLIELSSSIQIRKEMFDNIEKQNKWSIPLAIIGLILTVVFGIISLF